MTITSLHDEVGIEDKDDNAMLTDGANQHQLYKQKGLEVRYVLIDEKST